MDYTQINKIQSARVSAKSISVIVLVFVYLTALQGCATFKHYYTPSSPYDPSPTFEQKKQYQIRTIDGKKYHTMGWRIQWEPESVRFLDLKSGQHVELPKDQISEIKTKKLNTGLTVGLIVGSLAAVAGIALAIVYAGLKGTGDEPYRPPR